MAKPIATAENIAFAFPNVCPTIVGSSTVFIPYPSIADLSKAKPASDEGKGLFVKGKKVLLENRISDIQMMRQNVEPTHHHGRCFTRIVIIYRSLK